MARLKIVRNDGSVLEGEITPAVEYSFELHHKMGFHRAFREQEMQGMVYWLSWEIARLSIRLEIAPQQLLELDPIMLQALLQGLKDEQKEISDANRSKRGNRTP